MNPTTDQDKRILELERRNQEMERQMRNLQNILSSIMLNSTATKIYFKNEVVFDKLGKVGFFGVDSVSKPATVAAPSGGATVDSQSRTAIGLIITRLQSLGLIS